MKKHQKSKKNIIPSILISALFFGLFCVFTDLTTEQTPDMMNTKLSNPRSAESVSSNITIKIWLSFSPLAPFNLNRTEPFLWIDPEQPMQNLFFLFVQVLNSTNSTLTDVDFSISGSMIKSVQTEEGIELTTLFEISLYWDPLDNMFKTNISTQYKIGKEYKDLEANNLIELNAVSKNPNYQNTTEIARIFVARSPESLPSWFFFLAIGTVIFLSGIIILIIRYFKRSHHTVAQKIENTNKRLKELNRKMIDLDKNITRDELIKEHEDIIQKLEELSKNSNLIDESQENQSTSIERTYMKND